VKVLGIIALVVVLLFVVVVLLFVVVVLLFVVLLLIGGGHDPGRHTGSPGGHTSPSSVAEHGVQHP